MRSTVAVAVTALAFCGMAHGFSLQDKFTGYPAGSDGWPRWETGSIDWEMRDGVFVSDGGRSKDSAIVAESPVGRLVAVEVAVTVRESKSTGWKVAGLCIQQDPSNYWHLALVEAPEEAGKRHFVELTEMLDGTWLAQSQKGTKLSAVEGRGQGFDWEYGRTYRLAIELTPRGITGAVTEVDGTVRTKLGYAFDSKAVTRGRPGLTSGGLRTEFSDFSAKIGMEVPMGEMKERKAALPPYRTRGFPQVKGKATGFFHVEEIGGRWWTIDPHGNAFFVIGTDHANWNVHWCEKLGYAPYHRNVEKRYAGQEEWADSTVRRLIGWGFNSLGVNSSPSVRYKGLAHMDMISMGTRFAERDWITPKTTWTGFPNVFSPKFRPFCEKMARRRCGPRKDDPWLIGYFIDNELEWHAWTAGGPFADTFKLPAENSAKKALVEFFRERYAAPEEFNRAWGTRIGNFDEILTMTSAPSARSESARKDLHEWIRLLADRYFSVTSAAIRKYDPNHMIMGCRFAGGAPEIVDIAGKYCDVFSVNCYRRVDLERGVMADDFEEFLAKWYGLVKRPFIITEWSFPALDAGLPCKHGAGQRVPTQKDKAFAFTVFQKLLFSTPFVVGSNYFMWADEPELGISSTFPEDSNYGLVNVNDEVYEALTRAASQLHPLVYAIHSGQFADTRVRLAEDGRSFTLENSGTVDTGCKVTIWVDGESHEEDVNLPAGASHTIAPSEEALEKPGAHFLMCRADPHDRFIERGMGGGVATQSLYVPGAPWHKSPGHSKQRIPVLVTNVTGKALEHVPVSVRLAELPPVTLRRLSGPPIVVDQEAGSVVPSQKDRLEDGDEVAFVVERLGAFAAKTFFVYEPMILRAGMGGPKRAVRFRQEKMMFEIDNGVLTLAKTDPRSGNSFDRVSLGGLELGRFTPLVHQELAQNLWVGPDWVARIEASEGPVRLVLDITASRGGPAKPAAGEMKTAVDGEGREAARRDRARSFRTKYRFVIYPDRTWFTSRLVWIENTDSHAWKLGAYYHYLPSNIAGDDSDDEAKRTYWEDKAAGACLGIVPGSAELAVVFWKDKGGGQHPDAHRKLGVVLQPGERYSGDEPVAYVLAVKGRPWQDAARELEDLRKVSWRAFAPETR